MSLDKRLNLYRPDLADVALEGRVQAESFVAGSPRQVVGGLADLRRRPDADAPLDAQLWYGERVTLFEERDGWAWIQAESDRYVGYAPAVTLGEVGASAPTHRVSVPMTFRFPAPDIKTAPLDRLPMGAFLRVRAERDAFLELEDGGFVFTRHTAGADWLAEDWAETALRFLGVPYLWGGRSFTGIDCSGLVQTALLLAGRRVPRDSDMLRDSDALGQALPPDSPRQRGDLLFSPGHVVMALDGEEIVHANAYHLAVVREPFAAFVERLAGRGEDVTLLRRPA